MVLRTSFTWIGQQLRALVKSPKTAAAVRRRLRAGASVETLERRALLTTSSFISTAPVNVPDQGAPVASDIFVSGLSGAITQVEVRVNLDVDGDTSDINLILVSPSGTFFDLATGVAGGTNFHNTVFSTRAQLDSITTGGGSFTNTFAPEGNLKSLLQTSPNGRWLLRVQDVGNPDDGARLVDWSVSLTTAGSFSNSTDLAIPDNASVISQIPVSGLAGRVSQVQVRVNITHTNDADLTLVLFAPDSGAIGKVLASNIGGAGNNYTNTIFSTATPSYASITTGSAPFTGVFSPEDGFASLEGSNPNGTWSLRLIDSTPGNTGTLLDWSITVTTAADFNISPTGFLTAAAPNYDLSSASYVFNAAGLTVTPNDGTRINGLMTAQNFPGVTSLLAFAGTGDDFFNISSPGPQVQSSLQLFLSGGNNYVATTGLDVNGGTFIESGAGRTQWEDFNGEFTGITFIGGGHADVVDLSSTDNTGAATLLLGGGNNTFKAMNGTLGSGLVLGSHALDIDTSNVTLNGLTVFSGVGNDRGDLDNLTVNGGATFLLGGGINDLDFSSLSVTGQLFMEGGAGKLDVDILGGTSTLGSLLVIGGSGGDGTEHILVVSTTIAGAATFLMNGGSNTVQLSNTTVGGFAFVESGAGSLALFTGGNIGGGLLAIGGAGNDNISLEGSITGATTLLLGGGTNNEVTIEDDVPTTLGSFTVIASGAVRMETEDDFDASSTTFTGPALFIVGGSSIFEFGHNPLPSDPTIFQSSLTIFSGTPNSTLRRRNVTNVLLPTLINVTQIP